MHAAFRTTVRALCGQRFFFTFALIFKAEQGTVMIMTEEAPTTDVNTPAPDVPAAVPAVPQATEAQPDLVVEPVAIEPTAVEPVVDAPAPSIPQELVSESPVSAPTPAPASVSAAVASEPQSFIRELLARARGTIQSRKAKKLEKIMSLARTNRSIANDDVQKLLRVSDATATRHLAALVKAGKLKRTGRPSQARYEPAP